jgi:hypothetical protein
VTPASGQKGTLVNITGSGLLGHGSAVVSVTLAGVAVQNLVVSNEDTFVTVSAAEKLAAGPGDVVVTADTGATVTAVNGWTYLAQGVIASVTPASGQIGTRVTIRGSNLLGGGSSFLHVRLAGVEVQSITSQSDALVEVVAAAGYAGSGQIELLSNSGSSVSSPLLNCSSSP